MSQTERVVQRRVGVIVVLGVLLVAGLVWAAVALAGGSKPSASPSAVASATEAAKPGNPVLELSDPQAGDQPTADQPSPGALLELPDPDDQTPAPTSAPTSAPATQPTPTTPAATSTIAPGVPDMGPNVQSPVPLDTPAEPAKGVQVSLKSLKAVTATGQGIGEISGPAVAVTIDVKNATGSAVSLANANVAVYYGDMGLPASSVSSDKANKPLPTVVDKGKTVSGTYIFSIPQDDRKKVTVVVMTDVSTPAVVFTGSL